MQSAADVMTKNVITVDPDATLKDALKLMEDEKISHLVVVDKARKMLGIFSDRDVKKFTSPFVGSSRETEHDRATLNIKASQVMKTTIISVKPNDSIKACAEKILQKSIHALPVLDDDGVIRGIITSTNLIRVLVGIL
jgi:acetoin utilization protein AcuB